MQIERSDEINLIRQTLNGKTSAFNLLVKMHHATVYALVLSYTKNPADAEDLTQQIFIRAYERLATLRELNRFLPWLQRISHNTCKNWIRQQSGETIGFEAVNDADFTKTAPSPEDIALKAEIKAVVREAIGGLQETDRKLMEARYIEGASYSELQVESGLSYAAIVNRLKRAKLKVRRRIEKLLGCMAIMPSRTLILGGTETVKLSAKVKLATVGVAAVVAIGGGSVLYHRPFQSEHVVEDSQVISEVQTAAGDSPAYRAHPTDAKSGNNSPTNAESISKLGESDRFKITTDDGVKIIDINEMGDLELPEELKELLQNSAKNGADGKVFAALTTVFSGELAEEMIEKLPEAIGQAIKRVQIANANMNTRVLVIKNDLHKLMAETEELPEELKQKIARGEFVAQIGIDQEVPEEVRQAIEGAIEGAIEELAKTNTRVIKTQKPAEEPKQNTANADIQHLPASENTLSESTESPVPPTDSGPQVESPTVPSEPSEGTTPLSDEEWENFEKLLSEFSDEDWAEFERLLRTVAEGDSPHWDKQVPLDTEQRHQIEKALEEPRIETSAREEMRRRLHLPIEPEIDSPSSRQEERKQQDTVIPSHESQ